jgi:DNA polymerase (family X)
MKAEQCVPIAIAMSVIDDILAELDETTGLHNLTPTGSLRRFNETVAKISLIGTADNAEEAIRVFVSLPQVKRVLEADKNHAIVSVSKGLQVDLSIVPRESFGSGLQFHTGNREHNAKLRERARHQGLILSEHGITNLHTGEIETYATEKAAQNDIPELLEPSDIKGELHVHTNWSDGRNTIEEMALAAKARGYDYVGIADHSSSVRIARGEGYKEQRLEIRELNRKIDGIHILCGAEVDVMPDGSLEVPDEILTELDFVIAAVHRKLDLPRKLMTERIIRAIENPNVNILAHPTSRRVLPVPRSIESGPIDVDMEAVFQAAAKTDTVLEIDSMPSRLDLKDTYAYRARELGIRLVIDTDSHNTEGLRFINYGVQIARRAWCQASDILNTRPLDELRRKFDSETNQECRN